MKPRTLNAALLVIVFAGTLPGLIPSAAAEDRPNLVFILADDLGYGDLSCYGAPDIDTPHLDRLAEQGVRLTDAYANAPICSPTRAAFLTGRYQQRIGLEWAVYYQIHGVGLPPQETSIAAMMQEAGYATAMSGKWHLGYGEAWAPNAHGFDHFFGSLGGNIHYFEHYGRKGKHDLYLNTEPIHREGYATDLTAQYAVRFIEEMQDERFFLFVSFNAPHFPYQGPDDADRKVTPQHGWQRGSRETYVEMVEAMDAGVGRITAALKKHGLSENTLVVFTSDNGAAKYGRNAPCRKGKGTLWEGGIRVPCIARWPDRLPADRTSSQAAATMDWGATLVEVAGGEPPAGRPFDGINLIPILSGEKPQQKRTLFWRRVEEPIRGSVRPHRAVRHGKWKYIDRPTGERYLYNLAEDIGEQNNRVEQRRELADRLRERLDQWEGEMDPPLYDQFSASREAAGQ